MKRLRILQYGVGRVGKALLALIAKRAPLFLRELGLELQVVGLVRRDRVCWGRPCLLEAWTRDPEALEWIPTPSAGAPLEAALAGNERDLVVVDVTAAETSELIQRALSRGVSVVTANKLPLVGPLESFLAYLEACRGTGARLHRECAVGAALPVIKPLRGLVWTGDEVIRVQGCLSGTLGLVMEGLTRGESLSGIVREAHRRGFTEPDPREDLGGMDVARKALILSRCLGWGGEMTHVQVSSLVPEALRTLDQEAFWSRLEELDHQSFPRVEPGNVLRYLASIEPGKIEVGVTSVPLHSLWGNLRGTDNLIAIHSRRYGENPLVIQGAGAGTELTAAGILHDLLEVAR